MVDVNRRRLLAAAGGLALATVAPTTVLATARGERWLALKSLHTHESLEVTYWRDGRYLPTALTRLEHQLRDYRTGDVHDMDPRLFDLLCTVRRELGSEGRYDVISGYRSPKTNRMLRARSTGVAKRSLHMRGMAIDVRLPGRSLRKLREAAIDLGRGGVGYYPESGFVHLDVGRPRSW